MQDRKTSCVKHTVSTFLAASIAKTVPDIFFSNFADRRNRWIMSMSKQGLTHHTWHNWSMHRQVLPGNWSGWSLFTEIKPHEDFSWTFPVKIRINRSTKKAPEPCYSCYGKMNATFCSTNPLFTVWNSNGHVTLSQNPTMTSNANNKSKY